MDGPNRVTASTDLRQTASQRTTSHIPVHRLDGIVWCLACRTVPHDECQRRRRAA